MIADLVLLGELSLDGSIHPTRGVLPIAAAARRDGLAGILLPAANASEAAIVVGPRRRSPCRRSPTPSARSTIRPASAPRPPVALPPAAVRASPGGADLADVRGQLLARRALEIACGRRSQPAAGRTARRRQDDDGAAGAGHPAAARRSTKRSR